MSLSDDVNQALESSSGIRRAVAGYTFPSIGLGADAQLQRLEAAVASLANALALIAERLDESETSRGN